MKGTAMKRRKNKKHIAPQFDFWKKDERPFDDRAWFTAKGGEWSHEAWLAQVAEMTPKPAVEDWTDGTY